MGVTCKANRGLIIPTAFNGRQTCIPATVFYFFFACVLKNFYFGLIEKFPNQTPGASQEEDAGCFEQTV